MDGLNLATDKMLASVENGVGTMTYNHPERRNAFNHEMRLAIIEILSKFARDPDVRVIVVTGAGGKAFVSGADISEFDTTRSTPEQIEEYHEVSRRAATVWALVEKPIIAMIRGYCLGGGLSVALNADIRIATEGSQFGIPAARLGRGFGFAGTKQLVDLVGPASAAEILYTCDRFSASDALHMGLVNRVVADDALERTVHDMAATIAGNAPLTLRSLAVNLSESVKDPAERDDAKMTELFDACMASEDFLEGQRAFKEKRDPVFQGQ